MQEWLKTHTDLPKVADNVRTAAPFTRPSKIVCIGLNYSDHARETGAQIPSEPIIFFKSTTALVGPNDNLVIPRGSVKTDWEVELAVVIGKKATYVTEENANDHIAGYCVHNDYSERAYQLERNGQWAKGKGCDTFAPLGPYLVTKDEVPNVGSLRLWLSVNGKMFQDGNTSNLIFNVPFIVSYLSQFGDIAARRCYFYRYARRCRPRLQPADIPQGRRCGGAGHRRPGYAKAARYSVIVIANR